MSTNAHLDVPYFATIFIFFLFWWRFERLTFAGLGIKIFKKKLVCLENSGILDMQWTFYYNLSRIRFVHQSLVSVADVLPRDHGVHDDAP